MKGNQKGQVLLIIILLSTVLLTVALSVSQITTEETKISKLEEESKKAFAAAEAGVEARLKSASDITDVTAIGNLSTIGISQLNATKTSARDTFFYKDDMRRDDQLTFYLSDYDRATNAFANPYSGYLTFYFVTDGSTCASNPSKIPVFEVTFVSNDANPTVARKLIDVVDPDNCNFFSGKQAGVDLIDAQEQASPVTVANDTSGRTFMYKTVPVLISANVKLMLVRALFPGASSGTVDLTIAGSSDAGGATPKNLPAQGQVVTSSATTTTGVAKKIQLFQSYPQIPADLFVTSF